LQDGPGYLVERGSSRELFTDFEKKGQILPGTRLGIFYKCVHRQLRG
jgi:hypothetical protein